MADALKLRRDIERWRKSVPEAMAQQSLAAVTFALDDARHDILALSALVAQASEPPQQGENTIIETLRRMGHDTDPVAWVLHFNDPDPQMDLEFCRKCPKGWVGKAEPLYEGPGLRPLAARLAIARLAWLHSSASNNVGGYEWGVFRVKWEGGKAAEVWQTNSDFNDLDKAIKESGCQLPVLATPPASEAPTCDPTATECPRCKNNIHQCDGVFAGRKPFESEGNRRASEAPAEPIVREWNKSWYEGASEAPAIPDPLALPIADFTITNPNGTGTVVITGGVIEEPPFGAVDWQRVEAPATTGRDDLLLAIRQYIDRAFTARGHEGRRAVIDEFMYLMKCELSTNTAADPEGDA